MIQRYNMNAVYGMSGYTPVPDEHGDWVKWADIRDEIQKLKLKLDNIESPPKKMLCLKEISLGGKASTYCMLVAGHEGKCA